MPDRTALKEALGLIKTRADYEYFFSKLESPGWLEALVQEGLFAKPPEPIREGKYIRFPAWPESTFLARVAERVPDVAVAALKQVPDTNNVRVHEDLLDAALKISTSAAGAWALREAKWVERQEHLFFGLPEKIAKLVARLARAGERQGALALSVALFSPLPDPAAKSGGIKPEQPPLPPNPVGRCDTWDYEEALKIAVPALGQHVGMDALAAFSRLLESAVRLSSKNENDATNVDYSFIWRDAIEQDDRVAQDVRNALISAVRDIAVLAATSRALLVEAVELLEHHRWDVFRRIVLHLLRVTGHADAALVTHRVVNEAAFEDATIRHEYVLLLQKTFPRLTERDQTRILGWIERGPDREAMRERHRVWASAEPTEQQVQDWVEQWQRDRLSPIRDFLPVDWKRRFDGFVRKHGPPEFDFMLHKTEAFSRGLLSPRTKEQLQQLESRELRAFLREWTPSGDARDPHQPSRDGLAQAIASLDPAFFKRESETADEWADLHPAYVAALLSGFERIVREGETVVWTSILALCSKVAAAESNDGYAVWSRKAVADLLDTALARGDSIPVSERGGVWNVLSLLLRPDRPEEQLLETESDTDWLNRAINSVVGKGLEAAIRYAIWIKRSARDAEAGDWTLASKAPEMKPLLERFADYAQEDSLAVRAILGGQLEALVWLDRDWVRASLLKLFPTAKKSERLRAVVWNTFLRYGRPFSSAPDLFGEQYKLSVASLNKAESPGDRDRDPSYNLGRHLMSYYWQGLLEIDEPGSLISDFFERGFEEVRADALDFVGRSLHGSGEISEQVLTRLRALWDWRLKRTAPRLLRPSRELVPFGWWFASAKLGREWSLSRLHTTLRLAGRVEPDHMVAQQLLKMVEHAPSAVAECLLLMVEGDKEELAVLGWRDEAKSILRVILQSGDEAAQRIARETINALVARRLNEFKDLLVTVTPNP